MTDWMDMALPLAAEFEGCAKRGPDGLIHPYLDKLARPPRWTRGYGRTYGITETSPPIPHQEARAELGAGLTRYAAEAVRMAPALAGRPACLAAVTDWCWNCGLGAFRWSRLRKSINAGRWHNAAREIRTPRTAGGIEYRGLARRRDTEAGVFQTNL